ncbi:hypothetical protein Psed_5821 [Pseudonocardia dioxanivorans CB1190]|uniref:DUF3159 domain-containing protein n=1 Tax=Pseudonocardia dioxanivorans (strain ATCC 55486 / DSM 44775 / JCM 13855 / CB1190) TaxID=675635 RepID=F4D1F8_PSEUX|nr:DUF3159 domain-containing protein [Pseudonocardia dioxanivorans]AEA27946.1 hypothetical protein Psed_5821 [Pseudonocardia dioxanivorans CB1190]
MTAPRTPVEPTLREILGGRHGAVDATLPAGAFVVGWLVAQALGSTSAVAVGGAAAVVVAGVVATYRLARGHRPRSVLLGLLPVAVAVAVAVATGRAVDFFLVQIVSNAGSALAFAVSIVIRWPLLGVVVGLVLGRKTRWRRDPDLLRAYGRASWVWVGQYLVRLVVFLPLYAADQVVALGIARVALTWPLVAACVALSWVVVKRSLPADHPGLLHPVAPGTPVRPNDHGES